MWEIIPEVIQEVQPRDQRGLFSGRYRGELSTWGLGNGPDLLASPYGHRDSDGPIIESLQTCRLT